MNSRSPIRTTPLRRAGQWLDDEIIRVSDEISENFVMIFVFLVVGVLEWVHWQFHFVINPLLWAVFIVPVVIWNVWRIMALRRQLRQLRLGCDGEKVMGQHLESLGVKGFMVLHDLQGQGFNVDHLLIGTKGIFTIETKTVSKPVGRNAKITIEGEILRIGSYLPDRDPLIQAKAGSRWVHRLIREQIGREVPVKPVVIFLGWYVEHNGPKDVWVLNENAFPKWLENEKETLKPEDVNMIHARLAAVVGRSDSN